MSEIQRTLSPVDGSVYVERELADAHSVQEVLEASSLAQRQWRSVSVTERAALIARGVDHFLAERTEVAEEISWQMGRPISLSPGELRGFEERARYMIAIAEEALAPIEPEQAPGLHRFIRREPLGVVLCISPWNYPYLTAVNAVVPALLAGNSVVLRHSAQTPLCAERLTEAFAAAGLPRGVFQHLHTTHELTARAIASAAVSYVAFTGSVTGGRAVQQAASGRFINLGLELGGKDPAYVRSDADLEHSVAELVDGAFFNAGQSCCGIERIYVHSAVYERFVDAYAEMVRSYRLGNPLNPETTLGPLVRPSAADFVRDQIAEAVARGARPLVDPASFPADAPGSAYLAPQVLIDVDHDMRVMSEESFGPVVGIMPVASDDEAVELMNDSAYGLTASVWTTDEQAALAICDRIETGTCFMNRCDYLDPSLAWTGVKDSGRGATLSRVGFEVLTRPKSFHLRQTR